MRILNGLFGWLRHRRKRPPTILVDFVIKEGGMYLTICNLSPHPACHVCIGFDQPLMYFNGCKNLADHPIVQDISYLAPFKSIELFLDPMDIFFYHLVSEDICIRWQYKDRKGRNYDQEVMHDLGIYRHLPQHSRVDFLIED